METTTVTGNGVTIYRDLNRALHGFCLCLYLKAGLLYETADEAGITHFFEHAVIRNINKVMGGTLYETLDRNGLYFNGVTYREFVQFTIAGAREKFPAAAEIFLRLTRPLILSAEELQPERRRIKAEIREEQERQTVDYWAKKEIWRGTTLAGTIPGTAGSVGRMGKQTLCRARERLLARENMFFYLTGGISPAQADAFCRSVSDCEVFSAPVRDNRAPAPEEFFRRDGRVAAKNGEGCRMQVCFDADTSRSTRAERNLLYDCLFSGDSCGMYQELSEKSGYVYSYDATFEEYRNIGNLSFSFETDRQSLIPALTAAAGLLRAARQEVPRLETVRAGYTDNGRLILDDAEGLNWQRAYECHILQEPYRSAEERIEAYRQVRQAQITALAREIFTPKNLLIVYRGDKKDMEPERWREILLPALED